MARLLYGIENETVRATHIREIHEIFGFVCPRCHIQCSDEQDVYDHLAQSHAKEAEELIAGSLIVNGKKFQLLHRTLEEIGELYQQVRGSCGETVSAGSSDASI